MPFGLRIRVTWDDDVVQDQVFEELGVLRVGAGPRARAVAPGDPDRDVIFWHPSRGRYRLVVPPGAVRAVEFPGEDPVDDLTLARGFSRELAGGSGRLVVGDATVDFEILRVRRGDLMGAWLPVAVAAAACFALMFGFGYKLVRSYGDGSSKFGEATPLGERQAQFLRVTMDTPAQGASRLAAGEGSSVHGVDSPLLTMPEQRAAPPHDAPVAAPPVAEVHKKKHHPKRVAPPPPTIDTDEATAAVNDPVDTVAKTADGSDDDDAAHDDTTVAANAPGDQGTAPNTLVEKGQQAFLAAELRSSIDSLTAAEKQAPLDYDNLNWLGLAHYFLGENDQAAARWNQALALDGNRPDAVNNLGGIAKRKGDIAGEIAAYQRALALHPGDCHALNNMSLALAKQHDFGAALQTLTESDGACGGDYAYTYIQRAGILALQGNRDAAMAALEQGLAKVDTMLPIKEYEVEADLLLDPAFASLRTQPKFAALTTKYLPRAVQSRDQILHPAAPPAAAPPAAAPTTTASAGGDELLGEDPQIPGHTSIY